MVVDKQGQPVEADDGLGYYDPRADYALACGSCGETIEIQSPEDVEQLKTPSHELVKGGFVVRLT